MANIFARIHRPSLRQGLIFGLILGVVEIAYGFLASFITAASMQSLLPFIGLVLFIVFGFLAGQRAARETGKLRTGVLAGLWTGLIGSLVAGLVQVVGTLVNLSNIVATNQLAVKTHPSLYPPGTKPSDVTASGILTDFFIFLLLNVLFFALISLIGGAVGGMVGRGRTLASQSNGEYNEAMFEPPTSKKMSKTTDIVESAD